MYQFVLKIVAFGSLLVAGVTPCLATPSPSVWVTVTPLGMNTRDFFFLKYETRNPGSHYNYSETTSLVRCRTTTNELVESVLLRDAEYAADGNDEEWQCHEKSVIPFDMPKYLRDQKVHLLQLAGSQGLRVIGNQLVDVSESKRRVLVSKAVLTHGLAHWDVLGGGLSDEDRKVRLSSAWSASAPGKLKLPQGRLVVVESGKAEGESNFWQNVVYARETEYVRE